MLMEVGSEILKVDEAGRVQTPPEKREVTPALACLKSVSNEPAFLGINVSRSCSAVHNFYAPLRQC